MQETEITEMEKPSGFLANIDLKTAVLLISLVFGWAGSWFTMSARQDDQSRRISTLEKELVPRVEHDLRDASLNGKLDMLQKRLDEILIRVNKIADR